MSAATTWLLVLMAVPAEPRTLVMHRFPTEAACERAADAVHRLRARSYLLGQPSRPSYECMKEEP